MRSIDYNYIGTMIGNLFGVPIHIYKNNSLIFYHSTVNLIKDPISIYESDILKISEQINYFLTTRFNYFGILNSKDYKIVIGPTSQVPNSIPILRELAFQLNVAQTDVDDFINAMQEIIHMPLESLMQILCFLNYILNNEKCSLHDVFINDSLQKQFIRSINTLTADRLFSKEPSGLNPNLRNTYDLEQHVMNMIRRGEYTSLSQLLNNMPALKIGTMSDNHLRQLKDTFIVTATLASRSAIHGGMSPDDAFPLSDNYIQKCESTNDYYEIINLRHLMIIDFAKCVYEMHEGALDSQLVSDVSNYIIHHMSESITVEAMSKEFFMSRSYLSKRFKAESNITLTDFILNKKIKEAKYLLHYTNKSLTAISVYLGFSSPGHFSRVFRKYVSLSPNEYRKKHIT